MQADWHKPTAYRRNLYIHKLKESQVLSYAMRSLEIPAFIDSLRNYGTLILSSNGNGSHLTSPWLAPGAATS